MKNKKKIILCCSFVVLALCAICFGIYQVYKKDHTHHYINGVCDFCGKKESGGVLDEDGNPLDANSIVILPEKLTFTRSASESSEITVQATISPAEATNPNVHWSLAFQNPDDSWASGKTVTDYVSLTSDGLNATVKCLGAFGEEINLTCTSEQDSTIYASCTLNYLQRMNYNWIYMKDDDGHTYETDSSLEVSVPFSRSGIDLIADIDAGYEPYTIESSFKTTYEISLTDDFITYLENHNCNPANTSKIFNLGDRMNFSLDSFIEWYGLSPDQAGNTFTKDKISSLFYHYSDPYNAFTITLHTTNDNDASNTLSTTFIATPKQWEFSVAVQNIELNQPEVCF